MGAERLVQIVDAALAAAVQKAGPWLACRPGCTQCCIGVFSITANDAARLREGLAELDAESAGRVTRRARESVARMERQYPGDTLARLMADDDAAQDEPCPVLDPETGMCDLYEARPITCRTFGPPIRFGDGPVPVCELCFVGATDEQIAACAVEIDSAELAAGGPDETVVAYALAGLR